jgi:prophage maintenance system killer protein
VVFSPSADRSSSPADWKARAPGVRDPGALEAAPFRPRTGYYEDGVAESAALFESLAINHPFVDGNEQGAFAAVDVFLRIDHPHLDLLPHPAGTQTGSRA